MLQQTPSISQNAIHAAALLLAQTAREAGLPKDSLERFIRAGYIPQPKQLAFHAAARLCDHEGGPTEVGFGGARGPGKSHGGLGQIAIDDCQRFKGLKFLFLRKVGKAARESFEDLRIKLLGRVPHTYKSQAGVLHLTESGSRIILGHFNAEKDIDNYLGIEYDGALIEESNQISSTKQKQIKTSIRSSKEGWRPRIYHTFNPGGVGHQHTKEKFIKPWRAQAETLTRFIFATYRDNAFLNSGYEQSLNELSGWLRAAWRDGDWDIAAGQYFSTWRYDAIVKQGIKIMPGAEVWCSLDYGFQHPTVSYLFSEHDGKIQVVDEHWRRHGLVPEHVADIKRMLARHNLRIADVRVFPAGHDAFAQKGNESGKTIANEYSSHGIRLVKANIDRVSGATFLLGLLGRDADAANNVKAIAPAIEIDARCTKLIDNIPTLQHDPHRPEDVLKVNIDEDGNGGDDPYDSLRYGVMVKHRRLALY